MIKPWVFEFFPELGGEDHDPEPHDVAAYFARYLDLWVHDEALGFEGIFFSEHHFGGSFSASPNLLIATGFNSTETIKTIFDAYRDEAKAAGLAAGPDCLALRRRVTVAATPDEARSYGSAVAERLKSYVAQDSRVQQNVPDSPARAG